MTNQIAVTCTGRTLPDRALTGGATVLARHCAQTGCHGIVGLTGGGKHVGDSPDPHRRDRQSQSFDSRDSTQPGARAAVLSTAAAGPPPEHPGSIAHVVGRCKMHENT
jgi:hypothetical protein